MAPEILSGTLSDKTDVYSFGILLLEIVSGRKNNQFDSLSNDGATNIGIGGYASIFHFISYHPVLSILYLLNSIIFLTT